MKAPDEAATALSMRTAITPAPSSAFAIEVAEGPDRGVRLEIDGTEEGPVFVGKSPICRLRLTDPLVSRRHLSLEVIGRGLRAVDLGSTNGTLLGTVRLADATLRGGEALKVGDTLLAIERKQARAGVALPPVSELGRLVGMSREMRRLYPLIERLAAAAVPVLVEGETGTGKEVLAESLHELGPRAKAPFVVFDCTTVSPATALFELFGHEKAAFPGADAPRMGVFERANGGTLLLDEIADLDLALQPMLLRALERGEITRAGADQTVKVDVRIVAATRRDLDREVQEGRFRDDLFHRLVVARIELPPLRDRRGDVAVLAAHFARQLGGAEASLAPELLARWQDQRWPGNVRELRNAVARELALGGLRLDLPDDEGEAEEREGTAAGTPSAGPETAGLVERILAKGAPLLEARQLLLEDFDRAYLAKALAESGGNVTRAAAVSGLARRNFQILRARRGV